MIGQDTELTVAQHSRLDGLARANPEDIDGDPVGADPDAKVIGWWHGPIIRRGDGRVSRLVPSGRFTGFGSQQAKKAGL
jgi:hypothetical protein